MQYKKMRSLALPARQEVKMPVLEIKRDEQMEWLNRLEKNPEDLVKYWFRARLTEEGFDHNKIIHTEAMANGDILYWQ
jgi:hypothetical protein